MLSISDGIDAIGFSLYGYSYASRNGTNTLLVFNCYQCLFEKLRDFRCHVSIVFIIEKYLTRIACAAKSPVAPERLWLFQSWDVPDFIRS